MEGIRISLEAARVNANMLQDEAAKEMKVTKQTIVNWEKGRTSPTIEQARRLSDLYGIPLDNIIMPYESNLI